MSATAISEASAKEADSQNSNSSSTTPSTTTEQVSSSSNGLSDLRARKKPRKYATYTYDVGDGDPLTVRMQTLRGDEVIDIFNHPEAHRKLIQLSYALVDEHDDCCHTHDIESVAYLQEGDGGEFMWLCVTAEQHCFGGGAVGEQDLQMFGKLLSDLRGLLGDLTQTISSLRSALPTC